jgi:Ca-activated chloride channel homolog
MKHTQTFIFSLLLVGTGLLTGCGDNTSTAFNDVGVPTSTTQVAKSMPVVWYGTPSKDLTLDPDLMRRNFMVVIDGSGSMDYSNKMNQAKEAVTEFLKAVPAEDNLGLVTFDGYGINLRVPLGINNRPVFNQTVSDMRASGGTPLLSSIEMAVEALRKQAQRQQGYGEYHLLVVTDGDANPGQDPTDVVDKTLRFSPIVVHVIGFNIGLNHALNQPGRTDYKTADDAKSLIAGMKAVLAESPSFDDHETFAK